MTSDRKLGAIALGHDLGLSGQLQCVLELRIEARGDHAEVYDTILQQLAVEFGAAVSYHVVACADVSVDGALVAAGPVEMLHYFIFFISAWSSFQGSMRPIGFDGRRVVDSHCQIGSYGSAHCSCVLALIEML